MTDGNGVDREEELPAPPERMAALRPDVAAVGPNILPIVRLRVMSHDEWEDFVLEWAHSLKTRYAHVRRSSGSGDMGRDIIARESATEVDPWDNYQCKHYGGPLAPSEIWVEIGKLCWHTYRRAFSIPREFVFVSPWGAGPTLSNLLDNPNDLRSQLLTNWDRYCRSGIQADPVDLTEDLRTYIISLDFSIFSSASPLALIEEHRATQYHIARFGGGLPERPAPPDPPINAAVFETVYVRALLDAYEERYGATYSSAADVDQADAVQHLIRSRREFYSAESLREFSRDNVPDGTFEPPWVPWRLE